MAVYTEDVEHDVVGFPSGPCSGEDAARNFNAYLTANFRSETWDVQRQYFAEDAMVLEQLMTGTVTGSLLGLPGNGRRVPRRIDQSGEHLAGYCGGADQLS
ncbi:MAG: ester cyclase [Mycobacterium sp.]|uniref:ester cyclase n=1 Tax=Mycobacterium sp. TaxID=1785 RepID=UPI003C709CE4